MEYIPAKQILSRNRSTAWFGTDYTMNLYRGCCHGCIYCDSRSACYGIEDFGRVRAKENALALLRDELRRKVRPGIVGMGSMSDPYNPFEGELQLTRHALELLDAYGFGAAIATKGDGITRDIDVLRCMREHVPVLCKVTVTTTDAALAARVEPNAPSPPGGWRRWPGWRRRGCLLACCSCRFSPFWRTMWKTCGRWRRPRRRRGPGLSTPRSV